MPSTCFWQTKTNQLAHSTDKSNRGAVTGGKQLDGFIVILKNSHCQLV